MFPPRTALRSIAAATLVCGLLATSSAAARPIDDARDGVTTSSLAGTTSTTVCSPDLPDGATTSCVAKKQDLRTPDARDAASAEFIAHQMEQYYESFGAREPVTPPVAAAPANDSPWLLISVIAGGLALVLASTAMVLRRRRVAI